MNVILASANLQKIPVTLKLKLVESIHSGINYISNDIPTFCFCLGFNTPDNLIKLKKVILIKQSQSNLSKI